MIRAHARPRRGISPAEVILDAERAWTLGLDRPRIISTRYEGDSPVLDKRHGIDRKTLWLRFTRAL
jgi:hypothetical protein